jgi:hypothetical protein
MKNYHWSAYRTSKALLNTWSRFVLKYLTLYFRKYLKPTQSFVCMHPGWCKTDMGGALAPLAPEDGGKLIFDGIMLKEVDSDKFYNGKFCDYSSCK